MSVSASKTVNVVVEVAELALGVLALAISDAIKLRFAVAGYGPIANTDELVQS